ncbi:MAG: hypothetical protein K6F50_01370 [Kiritimatiellae bacterium]|nr:hypothetical protein [Kiritimatiellia bacterium]
MLKKEFAVLLLLLVASVVADDRFDALYKPLIDRFPFGKPAYDAQGNWTGEGPEPGSPEDIQSAEQDEVSVSEQEQALMKAVTVTLLSRDPITSVMQVGFTDVSNAKSPRHHLVSVGAAEDGWIVKDIDEAKKEVLLVKDGVEIRMQVGAAQAAQPQPKKARPVTRAARPVRSALLAQDGEASGTPKTMRSLRQERRERELERQRQIEADRKEREEEDARRREELARQREEEERIREQEKAEREAERAAEREEYKARLNDLAARLEQKMDEDRDNGGDGDEGENSDD